MKNWKKVRKTEKLKPRIIIYNMEKTSDEKEITECLKSQNDVNSRFL